MKNLSVLLSALVLFTVNPVFADEIDFDDGASHTLNDAAHAADEVYLDYYDPLNPGTHLNIVDGSSVYYVGAYNKSSVTVTGGQIYSADAGGHLDLYDNATATITGGLVYDLAAFDNSKAAVSGGSFYSLGGYGQSSITVSGGSFDDLSANNNAELTVSGGSVAYDLTAYSDSIINLIGTDFAVDGTPLAIGDKLSDFGTFVSDAINGDCFTGTITGILADGSSLDNTFYIYNTGDHAGTGDIVIVPEPATLALLGLGGLLFRRRKA